MNIHSKSDMANPLLRRDYLSTTGNKSKETFLLETLHNNKGMKQKLTEWPIHTSSAMMTKQSGKLKNIFAN
ncbi:hypothetical protein HID58_038486 [Brassica napus]|uniref:Uncharacterized protein n=1 Tax=Brassica napus TaxID=3708 RepID=A0ABQ8BPH4_BRANA|nr:hypothetical protein HID58_038486 [Brassica napus]